MDRQQQIAALIGARKKLPFAGKGGGTSKTGGACPRCGSQHAYRYYTGRFKRCTSCGYDRLEELIFDTVRSDAKLGRPIKDEDLSRALEYHGRVYVAAAK